MDHIWVLGDLPLNKVLCACYTMNSWKAIKLLLLLFIAATYLVMPVPDERIINMELSHLLITSLPLVFVPLAALWQLFGKNLKIQKPDWNHSFLDFENPEHFFHFAGHFFIVAGLSSVLKVVLGQHTIYPENFAPVTFGASFLCVVHVLPKLARST